MDLAPFDQIAEDAEQWARADLERNARRLSDSLYHLLRDRRWESPTQQDEQSLAAVLEDTGYTARLLDAAVYVLDKLLDRRDIPLHHDFETARERISKGFDSGEVPRRGFVYVAWSRRPERFLYVGKASTPDRLNLTKHPKLAHALHAATTLTLLFPTQSRADIIAGFEASMIELFNWKCGGTDLNSREEDVPEGEGSKDLLDLGGFLEKVGCNLMDACG